MHILFEKAGNMVALYETRFGLHELLVTSAVFLSGESVGRSNSIFEILFGTCQSLQSAVQVRGLWHLLAAELTSLILLILDQYPVKLYSISNHWQVSTNIWHGFCFYHLTFIQSLNVSWVAILPSDPSTYWHASLNWINVFNEYLNSIFCIWIISFIQFFFCIQLLLTFISQSFSQS